LKERLRDTFVPEVRFGGAYQLLSRCLTRGCQMARAQLATEMSALLLSHAAQLFDALDLAAYVGTTEVELGRELRESALDWLALKKLDADTVDAIITDPPYGIGVNGMEWDRPARVNAAAAGKRSRRPPTDDPLDRFQQFSREWSQACMIGLKPGGHLAAFAAPRTAHRLTCGLEEAGFEIRDVLMWLQGQGFPSTRVLPTGGAPA
jgi:hypothetical protein